MNATELRERATERVLPIVASTPALTAIATVLSGAAAIAGPPVLAVPGGLLLAFLLPGLALNAMIFRYRRLSAVERTVLAPALSMATMIVAGLGIHVAGFPLDRVTWTLGAAGITLAVLLLKAVPERVWPGAEQGAEQDAKQDGDAGPATGPFAPRSPEQRVRTRRLIRQLLPMLLVVGVLGGAGLLSFRSSADSYQVTVTTLSAARPGEVAADGARPVTVTASGLVAADGPYTVVVTDPAGTRTAEQLISAGAGRWTGTLRLPSASRMTIGLYRAGDTVAYRTVIVAATE